MADVDTVALLAFAGKANEKVLNGLQLQALLDLNGGVMRLAAADALEVVASDRVLTLSVVGTPEVNVDGAKVSAELRARAQALREQHYELVDADVSAFDVIDFAPYPWPPELTAQALT